MKKTREAASDIDFFGNIEYNNSVLADNTALHSVGCVIPSRFYGWGYFFIFFLSKHELYVD